MNKIDKFLYGGFAVVELAGIMTMPVSVFSPPKKTAEETTKTQKATLRDQIEDVPNQNGSVDAGSRDRPTGTRSRRRSEEIYRRS